MGVYQHHPAVQALTSRKCFLKVDATKWGDLLRPANGSVAEPTP